MVAVTRSPKANERAWPEAVSVHAHLMTNGRLLPVDAPIPGLTPELGEYVVGVLSRSSGIDMSYARYYAGPAAQIAAGGAIVVGSPHFLIGYLLGCLVVRARARRRLRRAITTRWQEASLIRTVVTTRRLWCEIAEANGPRWLNFNYDTITGLDLNGNQLTMTFLRSEPLSLSGQWAPWCAAVIAHYRYGRSAATVLPTLHAAATSG